MGTDYYSQIVALKSEADDIKRGRQFEQLVREIMPWDLRPPIVMSPQSEQLDGVFTYKGDVFLIESKAVKKVVTPGVKEWEDFELKLRKRERQNVIGIYCSLFEVAETTIQAAIKLNELGHKTIVISGNNWESLLESGLYFPTFLDFLIISCRIKFQPAVVSLKEAEKWAYDRKTIETKVADACTKISASFLRRFKHKYHDKIFIDRNIDKQIRNFSDMVKPATLKVANGW